LKSQAVILFRELRFERMKDAHYLLSFFVLWSIDDKESTAALCQFVVALYFFLFLAELEEFVVSLAAVFNLVEHFIAAI